MDLKELAYKNRVQKVTCTLGGEDKEFDFIIPVFLEALEFHKDFHQVLLKASVIESTLKGFGIDTTKDSKQIREQFNEEPAIEERERLIEIRHSFSHALLVFAVTWLPRVCEEFAELSEEEIASVVT